MDPDSTLVRKVLHEFIEMPAGIIMKGLSKEKYLRFSELWRFAHPGNFTRTHEGKCWRKYSCVQSATGARSSGACSRQ